MVAPPVCIALTLLRAQNHVGERKVTPARCMVVRMPAWVVNYVKYLRGLMALINQYTWTAEMIPAMDTL